MKIFLATDDNILDSYQFYKGLWIDIYVFEVYSDVSNITGDPFGYALYRGSSIEDCKVWIDSQ